MPWLFALGVLALAVYHPGFRKVLLIGAGTIAGLTIFVLALAAMTRP